MQNDKVTLNKLCTNDNYCSNYKHQKKRQPGLHESTNTAKIHRNYPTYTQYCGNIFTNITCSFWKVKPIWILLKQETVSDSGNSWAICKSAPRFRQITTPAAHHSVFTGRMPLLPPNQQRQSTEGKHRWKLLTISTQWKSCNVYAQQLNKCKCR